MRQIIKGLTIRDTTSQIEAPRESTHSDLPGIRLFASGLLALILSWTPAHAADSERQLDFYHTHTGKHLSVAYYDGKHYMPAALEEINKFLGDFRNGAAHPIDPATLDILFKLRARFGGQGTFEIISAYRSPETNAMLRKIGRKVARGSLHMKGKAIDVRLRGVDTARLRDAALKLRLGGVGYYRESDFVHVDSGRVRTW